MAMSVVYTVVDGVMWQEDRGGTITQYVPDTLGSVVAEMDEAGQVTHTADYWPYGEVRTETGTKKSPFGFVGVLGYMKDFADALYVRARYLRTKIARWHSVDLFWPIMKAYCYAKLNPISLIDPSGFKPNDEEPMSDDRWPKRCRCLPCAEARDCCNDKADGYLTYGLAVCGLIAGGATGICFGLCIVGGVFTGWLACLACLIAAGISIMCVRQVINSFNEQKDRCQDLYRSCMSPPPLPDIRPLDENPFMEWPGPIVDPFPSLEGPVGPPSPFREFIG